MYKLVKKIYWQMPRIIRNFFSSLRYITVRNYFLLKSAKNEFNWPYFYKHQLKSVNPSLIYIFEPNICWNSSLFQRPQQVALALGRLNRTVIYCTLSDNLPKPIRIAQNVWLVPHNIDDHICGVNRIIYSTSHLHSPNDLKRLKNRSVIIYEYIDHINSEVAGSFYEAFRQNKLKTSAIDYYADLVVASARNLYEEVSTQAPQKCVYIPNGVDFEHFSNIKVSKHPLFFELLNLKNSYRFIVGYYGAIAPWLWYELINDLSLEVRDVAFVFIGPKYGGESHLPNSPNIHYLGAIAYEELPPVAALFDVAFIPFKLGNVAQSTSPLKMYEYMALGKPIVVTSDLRECTIYSEVFRGKDLVSIKQAINDAYEQTKNPNFKQSLLQIASENTWHSRAENYIKMVDEIK